MPPFRRVGFFERKPNMPFNESTCGRYSGPIELKTRELSCLNFWIKAAYCCCGSSGYSAAALAESVLYNCARSLVSFRAIFCRYFSVCRLSCRFRLEVRLLIRLNSLEGKFVALSSAESTVWAWVTVPARQSPTARHAASLQDISLDFSSYLLSVIAI